MCIRDSVAFVAGVGDISTDLLSPGGDAHSRSDRQLHGQCMFEHNKEQQKSLLRLQAQHPDKRVVLIAEKGTMGVGSSRMSGVNNVALWIGKPASEYIPFINIAPVVAGTNGISPIFLTTVGVTGGIGLDLKNWKVRKYWVSVLQNHDFPFVDVALRAASILVFPCGRPRF